MGDVPTFVEVGLHLVVGRNAKEATDISVSLVLAIAAVCLVQIGHFVAFGVEAGCVQHAGLVAPTPLMCVSWIHAHMVSAVEMEPSARHHNQ